MSVLDAVIVANAIALGLAGLCCLARLVAGRTALDRVLAIDVLTAVVVSLAAVVLVRGEREDIGVLFIVLTLVSFLSSTVVGRFGRRYRGQGRIIDESEVER